MRSSKGLKRLAGGILTFSLLLSSMEFPSFAVGDETTAGNESVVEDDVSGENGVSEDNAVAVSVNDVEDKDSREETVFAPIDKVDAAIDEVYIAPKYYIDDNGKYPFGFFVKDSYITKVSLTINGISKEYDRGNYQDDEEFGGLGDYSGGFRKSNIRNDFNLENPDKYEIYIKAWDWNNELVIDGQYEVDFTMPEPALAYGDVYLMSDEIESDFTIALPNGWSEEAVNNMILTRNGKVYGECTAVERGLNYDNSIYDYMDIYDLEYSSKRIEASGDGMRFSPDIVIGDYDLVLEMADGNKVEFPNSVHFTDKAVITSINNGCYSLGVDDEYCYIKLDGINIMNSGIEARIVDESGTVCSSLTDVFFYESGVVNKLKKIGAALNADSSQHKRFYVELKGDYIYAPQSASDTFSDGSKTQIFGIINDSDISLHPNRSYYNWKKNSIVCFFDSSVPAGAEIEAIIYSKRDDDWELGDSNIIGTAKIKTENDRSAEFTPVDNAGTSVDLWDYMYTERRVYAKLIYGEIEEECEFSSDGMTFAREEFKKNDMYFAAPDFMYTKSKLFFYAYGKEKSHKTDAIYARIEGLEESFSFDYDENRSNDVLDYYRCEIDDDKNTLEAGQYKVTICETVEGKEVILCEGTIRVENKGAFHQNFITSWIYGDHAEVWIQSKYIDLGQDCSPGMLKERLEDLGIKVDVFDDKLNTVNGYGYTVVYNSLNVGFIIEGLDDYNNDYYFRVTKNGKTPIKTSDGKEYYSDPIHGNKGERNPNFYSSKGEEHDYFTSCVFNQIYVPYNLFILADYDINMPYKAYFYEEGKPDAIKCIEIDASKIDHGVYYLTKGDVKELDPNKMYHCELVAGNRSSKWNFGFFSYSVPDENVYDEEEVETVQVDSVSINNSGKTELSIGETLQLTADIQPSNASNKTVIWESSKPAVATIDTNGLVTAIAKGETKITVTTVSGNKTNSIRIKVTKGEAPVQEEELYDSWEIENGLTASVYVKNNENDRLILKIDGAGNVLKGLGNNHEDVLAKVSTVILATGITHIGEGCFEGMNSLQYVTLPRSLAEIGGRAFAGCGKLGSIEITEKVRKIGNEAFAGCGITEITIPGGCEDICGAFRNCTGIERVIFEKGDKPLNIQDAFLGCTKLKSITLPERCYNGEYTEKNAKSPFDKTLSTIAFEVGCTKIPTGICSGVSGLETVVLPDSVKEIGTMAFSECTHLEEIRLPKGLTGIKSNAFYLCNSLLRVYSPKNQKSITIASGNDALLEAEWIVSSKESSTTGMITIDGVTVPSLKDAFKKMDNASKDYIIVLGSDVIGEKGLTIPKTAKSLTIQGNGYSIFLSGNKIVSNTHLVLENVRIAAQNNKGKLQKLAITAKKGMIINNNVDYSAVSLSLKTTGQLVLNGELKADAITCDELVLYEDGILKVPANAKITIKNGLKGQGGCIELLDVLSKAITLNGGVSGDPISFTGSIQPDGTQILKTNAKKISAKELEARFDVESVTENTTDTTLVYYSSGKACIFGKSISYRGKDYALWKDMIAQVNADRKLGDKEFDIELNGNVNVKGALKMPVKGYEQFTISGNGYSLRFTGNIKLTGNTTITEDTELIRVNGKGEKIPGKVIKGKYLYWGPETF